MTSFLIDYTKQNVEKLLNEALKELRYICCFTCIVNDFEEGRVWLEAERTAVGQRVKLAKRRGEDVLANALFWEEEADKLIQENTKTKQKCFFGLCPHCIWRYRRGKELENKKQQIKYFMKTGKELAIGLPATLPDVERYPSRHYISFKSREFKYKELLDALNDDTNYIIGLQGMGGIGKTTLAKEVGMKLKQSKQFSCIIDTTVSFSPNIKKIQDDIAGPLGLKFDDCSESDRPKKLWKRLTNNDEKILLILDDVWGDIDFEEIGIPYNDDNHKGCRVLITTRNLLVCNKLGCNKTIRLELLSEEDAWEMFKHHAGLTEISTKSLQDKGRKIANECKRLPIAIAAIASSLKGKQHREEWDVALKFLQKHASMHDVVEDDDLFKIYKCLKFSYDNMNDGKAKRLFLLCSVFREDEEIPTERLIRLGIGAGLFGENYGNYEDARVQVVMSNNKLLDSCLLLEVDQKRVKMHDLVRDAAQMIANKEIQTLKLHDKNLKAMVEREKNIKYLLCEGNLKDVLSCKLDSSKLQILIVIMDSHGDWRDKNTKVPNSFFENISGLRVFQFIACIYPTILSLPQSIQSLNNIRSLLFRGVDLGDISILENLQSLETLDLEWCTINELPDGFAKLSNLRLLNLRFCKITRNNPFEVIEGCSSLEELYFIDSFNDFCREITFPMLQRFIVDDNWSFVDDSISKCVSILNRGNLFSEKKLKECMQTAEVLRLTLIRWGWINIIPEIVPMDQGMNDLVELRLSHISQLMRLIDTKHGSSQVKHVLSKLVILELQHMGSLEELCNGPLFFDSLKSLERLTIQDCNKLKSLFKCNLNLCNLKSLSLLRCPMLISLFQLTTARSLVSLEKLRIICCSHLEYIITDERKLEESRGEIGEDDDNNDSKRSHSSMFPKLKNFQIIKCHGLEFILQYLSIQDLPALEFFSISGCEKLQYIFGQYVQLGSLKKMSLECLPNFINVFPKCHLTRSSPISRDASKPEKQPTPLERSIISWTNICCFGKKYWQKSMSIASTKIPLVCEDQQQDCLIALESNSCSLNIWERVPCLLRQSLFMWNIKEIVLVDISKIESIYFLSIAPRILLETLRIRDCRDLKHIIDTGDLDSGGNGNNWHNVFPKLQMVKVQGCMKLEYLFGYYSDAHQNHNEIHIHLPALEHLYLWSLPNLVATCPNPYRATFPLLKDLEVTNCLQFAIKSVDDLTVHSVSQSLDSTINKVSLNYLTCIKILRCEKLEFVFSTSILGCLPLVCLRIEECKELKYIIKDDLENEKSTTFQSSSIYFPELETLVVVNCNKLKCVFQSPVRKELPKLKILIIKEVYELQEIFKSEGDDQKLEIPNLEIVAFINLPNLCHAPGVHFQAVKHRLVQNCHKLSLTSTSKSNDIDNILGPLYYIDDEFYRELLLPLRNMYQGSPLPSAEITRKSAIGVEAKTSSGHILTSSQVLINEQSMDQKHSLGETDTTIKPQLHGSTIQEKTLAANSSTILEEKKEPPIQLVAPKQKIRAEDGITSTHSKSDSSLSPHLELVNSTLDPLITSECKTSSKEDGDFQIATTSLSIATTETNDEVSLNADASRKLSSNIEEQFPKDDKMIFSKSKPSPSTSSPIASRFPSIPSKGDPSQNVEKLSSSLLVTRELEQLVSKKHLDYDNVSLLTDFLVKHPSVLLRDTSLSSRYKGYACNCLAELLKFLQTHSVLDVLGSNHYEFVELLQDVRRCGFDKEWLDGVERRVMFPDIQVSPDTVQKLLDSKQQAVSKEVEVLRLKIAILSQCAEDLNHQLTDLKHQLTSSEALLESIIQQKTVLSAPIGY